ncbi:hypothetical protein UFOVP708_14 [uncultured Caudovirales phage]|uniref:Uncharacterized protein n=1 Tax=uncultured Caudovirales phage TaxID=2100421 RepID=A0A6J5NFW0_9CAUD|nr:hypothetical protein UFOVP708_14 [uncultured Caudovirales phage]
MALDPQFAATPKIGIATVATPNTNRDGTGTIGTVLTAGASGTRIRRIEVQATGNTTAGMARLFIHDGTTAHLYLEVPISAATPSGTVQAFAWNITESTSPDQLPLTLPTGHSLRASTHNAEAFKVIAEGADL